MAREDEEEDVEREEDQEDQELDFEQDVKIDIDNLEYECLRQPQLMARYSSALSQEEKEVKRLELKKKTVRSELILAASNGEAKGLAAKPTGQQIEAYYRTHPRYRMVTERLVRAEYRRDMNLHAVNAIRQRKDMIQELIRLLMANYFSGPTVPKDIDPVKVREAQSAQHTEQAKSKLKRRKK